MVIITNTPWTLPTAAAGSAATLAIAAYIVAGMSVALVTTVAILTFFYCLQAYTTPITTQLLKEAFLHPERCTKELRPKDPHEWVERLGLFGAKRGEAKHQLSYKYRLKEVGAWQEVFESQTFIPPDRSIVYLTIGDAGAPSQAYPYPILRKLCEDEEAFLFGMRVEPFADPTPSWGKTFERATLHDFTIPQALNGWPLHEEQGDIEHFKEKVLLPWFREALDRGCSVYIGYHINPNVPDYLRELYNTLKQEHPERVTMLNGYWPHHVTIRGNFNDRIDPVEYGRPGAIDVSGIPRKSSSHSQTSESARFVQETRFLISPYGFDLNYPITYS